MSGLKSQYWQELSTEEIAAADRERTVVVIPVGAMHAWTSIPDHVTYLSIRVDPDQVLPTGYVNPEIQ